MICKHSGKECLLTGIDLGDKYLVRPKETRGLWLDFSEMGLEDGTKEEALAAIGQKIENTFCSCCPIAAAA